jgi:hypothetical protein
MTDLLSVFWHLGSGQILALFVFLEKFDWMEVVFCIEIVCQTTKYLQNIVIDIP